LLDNNGKPDFHLVCEKNENVFKSILLLIYVGTLDGGVVTCYSKNLKNSESEKCFQISYRAEKSGLARSHVSLDMPRQLFELQIK
jgi:hypothetical protein